MSNNFEHKHLSQLCTLLNGLAFKPEDWSEYGHPIIRIQNLNGSSDFNFCNRAVPSQYMIPPDTVLFSWSGNRGTSFGPYWWKGPSGVLNQHIFKVLPKPDIYPRWLYYSLDLARQEAEQQAHGGSGLVHVRRTDLLKYEIPTPPLPEQRRIAETLDTIDKAIQKTEALISKLKAMKQGLLHDLLTRGLDASGKLRDPKAHPEQFKDSPLGRIPKSWDISRGINISELITKGESPNWQGFSYENEGVLFITSENVRDGFLYVSYPKFISPKFDHKLKRSRLKPGDVLINLVGASIGRSCLFLKRFEPANINQAVCLLRLRNSVKPDWIVNYLQLPIVISRLLGEQVETARPNLSLTQISDFLFPIPPLYEQTDVTIILIAHDTRIHTEEQYRDKLKLQKKGLMHDLLSGKVRVKE